MSDKIEQTTIETTAQIEIEDLEAAESQVTGGVAPEKSTSTTMCGW